MLWGVSSFSWFFSTQEVKSAAKRSRNWNVKVCPEKVFIFVARPQVSYLANCHYFSKLPFPLPSWDRPLLNNLKKTLERGGFPHLDACNLDMGYLEAGYQDVHCTLPWCGLTRCTIVDVLYLDVGKRSKDSDTTLCSNCKGCVPAIKAFIAKV